MLCPRCLPLTLARALTPLQVGSSAAVNSGDWTSYYSAVCWLAAAEMFDTQLQRSVPVGLVSSNWVISATIGARTRGAAPLINHARVSLLPLQGGTYIQPWAPAFLTKQCGMSACEGSSCVDAQKFATGSGAFDPQQPGVLYNNMVYPFRYMNFLSEYCTYLGTLLSSIASLQASFGTKPRATCSAKRGRSTPAFRSHPQSLSLSD